MQLSEVELEILESGSFVKKSYESAVSINGNSWRIDFLEFLKITFDNVSELKSSISGYKKFIFEAMRLQERFNISGRYECSSYEEALISTYKNPSYMTDEYLPGLLISNFLWQHHVGQKNYFINQCLSQMLHTHSDKVIKFCDVGVGTGYYSYLTANFLETSLGTVYDISPTSILFAERLFRKHQLANKMLSKELDVMNERVNETYDLVICNEVLEHLEDPVQMVSALGQMVNPKGLIFLTAAINAANRDHIYLYEGIEDVREQVLKVGLKIVSSASFYAYGGASNKQKTPEVAALVLTK